MSDVYVDHVYLQVCCRYARLEPLETCRKKAFDKFLLQAVMTKNTKRQVRPSPFLIIFLVRNKTIIFTGHTYTIFFK